MKALSEMTTSELIAEYSRQIYPICVPDSELHEWLLEHTSRLNSIAKELDRRCEEWGIYIDEVDESSLWPYQTFHYDYFEPTYIAKLDGNGNAIPCPAKEQHDLEGWLLMKGGTNV